MSDGLNIPDGVSISHNRQWIAISNHNEHCVFLYKINSELGPHSRPSCILKGVCYPHGLRFAADANTILVADAGAPFVHIYKKAGNDWSGEYGPAASIRVMDKNTFRKGQLNPVEGGPKGLDIDDHTGVAVVTCAEQPIAFFNTGITSLHARDVSSTDEFTSSPDEQVRTILVGQIEAIARSMAIEAEKLKDEIRDLHRSRSWRITSPLRTFMHILRKIRDKCRQSH